MDFDDLPEFDNDDFSDYDRSDDYDFERDFDAVQKWYEQKNGQGEQERSDDSHANVSYNASHNTVSANAATANASLTPHESTEEKVRRLWVKHMNIAAIAIIIITVTIAAIASIAASSKISFKRPTPLTMENVNSHLSCNLGSYFNYPNEITFENFGRQSLVNVTVKVEYRISNILAPPDEPIVYIEYTIPQLEAKEQRSFSLSQLNLKTYDNVYPRIVEITGEIHYGPKNK